MRRRGCSLRPSGTRSASSMFGAALTVVTGGVVAAFVGPSAAWLAAGIALGAGVAVYAAATAKRLSAA